MSPAEHRALRFLLCIELLGLRKSFTRRLPSSALYSTVNEPNFSQSSRGVPVARIFPLVMMLTLSQRDSASSM